MNDTFQFENITIYVHGEMVHDSYLKLINALNNNNEAYLQKWTGGFSEDFKDLLLENQYDMNTMQQYHIYHDCGKPYCRTIDENGRQHFADHAKVSKEVYEQYFDNATIASLIENDMQFHTLKGEELSSWLETNKNNKKFLASLYLTAWSEIIANSSMFGGEESISFKIKKKALIKAGKKLIQSYR